MPDSRSMLPFVEHKSKVYEHYDGVRQGQGFYSLLASEIFAAT